MYMILPLHFEMYCEKTLEQNFSRLCDYYWNKNLLLLEI